MLKEKCMRLAIQMAEGVKGQTTPNPPVGAVVVKDGAIVGFGAHLEYGTAHAEVVALEMAKEKAEGAYIYVTLEPCSHTGRTPPCADLLIEKGIKKVYIACLDAHEKVNGKGMGKLIAAGIEVEVGLLKSEAQSLYKEFFHFVQAKRPFVTIKTAVSLDGKIATSTGESKWITDKVARMDAHGYRHTHDAILVGVNTVLHDNPSLTTRIPSGRNPVRVILDTHLRTPTDTTIISDQAAETWLFVGCQVTEERKAAYVHHPHVRIFSMEGKRVSIHDVLHVLYKEKITTVLVEGGGQVNDAFLQEKAIDQFIIYQAPIIIGGAAAKSAFTGKGTWQLADALQFDMEQVERIGQQIKIVAKRKGV